MTPPKNPPPMQHKPEKPLRALDAVQKTVNYMLTVGELLPPGVSFKITIDERISLSLFEQSPFAINHALQIDTESNRDYESLAESYERIARYVYTTLKKRQNGNSEQE